VADLGEYVQVQFKASLVIMLLVSSVSSPLFDCKCLMYRLLDIIISTEAVMFSLSLVCLCLFLCL